MRRPDNCCSRRKWTTFSTPKMSYTCKGPYDKILLGCVKLNIDVNYIGHIVYSAIWHPIVFPEPTLIRALGQWMREYRGVSPLVPLLS